jgi:hypothetical protein
VTTQEVNERAEQRQDRRDELEAKRIAQAVRTTRKLGRSIKCGELYRHTGSPDGCANDGSSCLCECHDFPATQETTP